MEASDHAYFALSKSLANAITLHLKNLGLGVHSVGDDADLATRETDGVNANTSKGHTNKSHGDALARGEQHVKFAGRLH